eukprot:4435112-Amphidinium_carterae.2
MVSRLAEEIQANIDDWADYGYHNAAKAIVAEDTRLKTRRIDDHVKARSSECIRCGRVHNARRCGGWSGA